MQKRIIIINGKGGVGKDTFVNLCGHYTAIENYSSVEDIKKVAKLLGWAGAKTEKDRKFLSDLKQLSSNYNNYPFQQVCKVINNFKQDPDSNLLFIHIREKEEIEEVIKNYPDVQTLLIVNPNVKDIHSNVADADVNSYKKYTYIIYNDRNLIDLEAKAKTFITALSLLDDYN